MNVRNVRNRPNPSDPPSGPRRPNVRFYKESDDSDAPRPSGISDASEGEAIQNRSQNGNESEPACRTVAHLVAVVERELRQLGGGDGLSIGEMEHLAHAITGAGEAIAESIRGLGRDLDEALRDIAASICESRR